MITDASTGDGLRLLGPIEWVVDGRQLPIGHPRQRSVLAVLALDAGSTVPIDALIDRVWGTEPPNRARNVVASYVARLRASVPADTGKLTWHRGGYRLQTASEHIDLWRFRWLAERSAASTGDPRGEMLDRALALWRGTAFGGTHSLWLANAADVLDSERLAAQLARAELSLAQGRHEELAGSLPALAACHPLNERIVAQLMIALYRCGRVAEALTSYAQLCLRLREDLGVDPGPALRELHRQVLHADPALGQVPVADLASLSTRTTCTVAGRDGERCLTVPRQLPAGPAHFTGRATGLRALQRGERIITIVGPPGIGKSALALHWAHSVAASFPDGQMFVNLRGFDPHHPPLRPDQALLRLLRGLGEPTETISDDIDEQAARYRSLLATRRVLVVLDNAADSTQVRDLLPGRGESQVVITSRLRLHGLATGAAGTDITLSGLGPAESSALLARVVGRRRVAAEPAAAADVSELCGGLPLALRIAANYLAARPELALAEYAATLADRHQRLDALAAPDGVSVRAVFALSVDSLDEASARALRLCALTPGPTFSEAAVAALLDTDLPATAAVLDRLRGQHLLEPAGPGRYQLHDLMRAYAAERAEATEPTMSLAAATRRLRLWYLAGAVNAHRLLAPGRYQDRLLITGIDLPKPPDGLVDHASALHWCDAHASELLATVRQSELAGDDELTWRLSLALGEFFELRRPGNDCATTFETGLAAARRCANAGAQGCLLAGLGLVHYYPRRFAQAMELFASAWAVWQGDDWGSGLALNCIGNVFMETRQLPEALRHYHRALRLLDRPATVRDAGAVLNNLAEAHCLLGRFEEAFEYARRSLDIAAAVGSRRIEVFSCCHAGQALDALGRPVQARAHLVRALHLARGLESRHLTAWALNYLGEHAARSGRPGKARRHWREAIALFTELTDPQADDLRKRIATLGASAGDRDNQ